MSVAIFNAFSINSPGKYEHNFLGIFTIRKYLMHFSISLGIQYCIYKEFFIIRKGVPSNTVLQAKR